MIRANKAVMQKALRLFFVATCIVLIFYGAILLSQYLAADESALAFVTEYRAISAIIIAFIAGINFITPFPPAVFTPVFETAGISIPLLIGLFAIGTTLADSAGYFLGHYSRTFVNERYPKTFEKIGKLQDVKRIWLLIFIFFYAAFAPFPNETVVIPLALLGIKLRTFVIPLVLGNVAYHTVGVFGIQFITGYFLL